MQEYIIWSTPTIYGVLVFRIEVIIDNVRINSHNNWISSVLDTRNEHI